MGRSDYSSRIEVEECLTFDAACLHSLKFLTCEKQAYFRQAKITYNTFLGQFEIDCKVWTTLPDPHIEVLYFQDREYGEKEKFHYKIFITTTPCHFGGFRYWFLCPNMDCKKRARSIYARSGLFLCRHCHNLTYRSRRRNLKGKFRAYEIEWIKDEKIKKLEKKIMEKKHLRFYYAGKPTKIFAKIQQISGSVNSYEKIEEDKARHRYQEWLSKRSRERVNDGYA
ncbi:MAG: hypothetical protein ACR2LN_01105 [Candidatus Levyibacteriota bacterium]